MRLVQEGKYYPLGEDVPKLTDAKIIVATNRDIEGLMKAERFRRDLYYRLQTHHIHVPPLRDRREDLPLLVEHFLDKAAEQFAKNKPTLPAEFFTLLGVYHFPGNIRELESMIFDAVSRHKRGVLSMKSFEAKIGHPDLTSRADEAGNGQENPLPFTDLLPTLDQLPALKDAEQSLIMEALKRSDGNQTIAARLLGMSRQALHNRLSRARKSME